MGDFYGVESDGAAVRAWSIQRLPYEPKGWLLDYREELRRQLRSLVPVDGARLRAKYSSPDQEFSDLENVLLYNVGAGSYRHLTSGGLEVLRTKSPDARHYVTYELSTAMAPELPGGDVVAEVTLDEFPDDREKVGSWWALMRSRLVTHSAEVGTEFIVDVAVRGAMSPFVSLIKPALDRLVSALHVHDGTYAEHVQGALARYGDPAQLWSVLIDPRDAILGRRVLARPHGAGIAWNPADDRCAGFTVIPVADGPRLAMRVRSA